MATQFISNAVSPTECAWCGRRFDADAERLGGRIRCAGCGVGTTDPWPTEADLERAYGAWYRPASGRFAGVGDAFLRWTRGRLARRLDAIAPAGRILDVGAGDGALLDALHARGRDALGLERHSERADVLVREVEELEGEWAAVVLWHSLEHLRAPEATIRSARWLLVRGGALVIAAPNAASWQARLFGDRWFALDLPRHLVHIPAQTLVATIEDVGMQVERVSYVRGGQVVFGWLHGLVGWLPGQLDLYDAIRRPEARRAPMGPAKRLATLAASGLLVAPAALAGAAEILARQGGTTFVEARLG